MDPAHVKDIGLFLILVDSFSRGIQVIKVTERKATTVMQVLRTLFPRKRLPKTMYENLTMRINVHG